MTLEQDITPIILLTVLLIAIGWSSITICRRNLQKKVTQYSSQLKKREQELEQAESEAAEYRRALQKLSGAVASLEYAELTATTVEKDFNDLWIILVPALSNMEESTNQIMQRLVNAMYILDKYSVALAGIEQVLLAVVGMENADMLGHMVLSYYTYLIPAELQEPAKEVINNIVSGHLDNLEPLVSTALDIMEGVIHLYQTNPKELISLATHLESSESLITHFLDASHLEVYAHGLEILKDHLLRASHESLSDASHLQHADNLSSSAACGFDIHIPWFTATLSLLREFRLLTEHKTTLDTSLKNVLLDISGSVFGAAVGSAIASVVAPGVGPIVAIGAMLGAMLFRFWTNEIKMTQLKNALEALRVSVNALIEGEWNAASNAVRNVNEVANQQKHQIELQIGPMPRIEGYLKQQPIKVAHGICREASAYIQNVLADINKARMYAGKHWYRDLLVMLDPNVAQLTILLDLVEGRIRKAEQALPSYNDIQSKPVEALKQLACLSIPLPTYKVDVEDASTRVQDAIGPYRKQVIQWWHNVASAFPPIAAELKPVIEQAFQEYSQEYDTLLRKVDEAVNNVNDEKQKLGK